jgi:succinate dehydrogenase / fumarate reductase flavoprotein subunit
MHGSNRLGGNSLSDLLVFGRRAGLHAAEHVKAFNGTVAVDEAQVEEATRSMLAPFERETGESPYALHADLQECMQNLVGIIRNEVELKQALDELATLKERRRGVKVEGNRQFNPGWHLALDLHSMLSVSEAITRAAIERKESRGGHTREDYPGTDPQLGGVNIVVRRRGEEISVAQEPLPQMPDEIKALLEEK